MIEIYRKINKEETLVASVPDDNATLEKTLMGADEVTLSVTVSEPLDLRVGDYAHLEGSSYMINRTPDLVKASAVEFRYDLVLESPLYNLLDKIYISDVQGLSRFSLSGTLNDFVELLLMNINRDDFDPGWTWATDKGDHPVTVVTERKNLSFDNTTCRDVLNRLADEFGWNTWFVTGRSRSTNGWKTPRASCSSRDGGKGFTRCNGRTWIPTTR